MKPISVHVNDQSYREFKSLSAQTGKPIAALIREAMESYLKRQKKQSVLNIQVQPSGPLLLEWSRQELYDE